MASEAMDVEEVASANPKPTTNCLKKDSATLSSKPNEEKLNGNSTRILWSSNGVSGGSKTPVADKDRVFTFINSGNHNRSSSENSAWSIRSPQPIKVPLSCPTHALLRQRNSHENGVKAKKLSSGCQEQQKNSVGDSRRSLVFSAKSPSSAFTRNFLFQAPNELNSIERESNILKRCNSAPLLTDLEIEEMSASWSANRLATVKSGRMRRFSATIVSLNASPASGSRPSSRLRLHQLKKEESLEGIQNKETEHEREVQATIQISSNCSDLTLGEQRRTSLDSYLGQSFSPRNHASPSSLPLKPQFPAPTTGAKSSHTRAIDFNTPHSAPGALSPTPSPLHQHPSSGGIPSPLTFSPSPSLYSSSPLPPSPTRALCGPGKQCFSPSMQIPVSFAARTTSRSPSPSPTRRNFVTRRRSQSPCIMRPSALGAIKRKCDSDNECSSPKRAFAPAGVPGVPAVPPDPAAHPVNSPFQQRILAQRSLSLSSSSMDSSDTSITPSPPYHPCGGGFQTHHLPSPLGGIPRPQHHPHHHLTTHQVTHGIHIHHPEPLIRPASPASSTCSSSSLEGIRDLQPLTSPGQNPVLHKKVSKTMPEVTSPNALNGPATL